ncbi:Uncharacterised protein [Mycobacteroides abscessus subsp. abscessus]|nr:Uncharacterised protein [Mycobacteroides abscessus subsp. abscessus]
MVVAVCGGLVDRFQRRLDALQLPPVQTLDGRRHAVAGETIHVRRTRLVQKIGDFTRLQGMPHQPGFQLSQPKAGKHEKSGYQ